MRQLEMNKEELFGMMEQLGNAPLSRDSICDLSTLMGAYKALCLVSRKEQDEEPEQMARAHTGAKGAG